MIGDASDIRTVQAIALLLRLGNGFQRVVRLRKQLAVADWVVEMVVGDSGGDGSFCRRLEKMLASGVAVAGDCLELVSVTEGEPPAYVDLVEGAAPADSELSDFDVELLTKLRSLDEVRHERE